MKVLTDPSVFSAWPWDVGAPPLSFFFFLSSSRCSFCRFCTSISAEMKLFFTSFSKSSSSLRASCCTSSSENLLMFISISSRRSFSSATLRALTPAPQTAQRSVRRLQASLNFTDNFKLSEKWWNVNAKFVLHLLPKGQAQIREETNLICGKSWKFALSQNILVWWMIF